MKIKYFILFILLCNFSQSQNVYVNYKKIVKIIKKEGQETVSDFSLKTKESGDKQYYELHFNNTNSKCILKENLTNINETENYYSKLAYVISNDYDYYFNLKTKKGLIVYDDGYKIMNDSIINWNITNETKNIESFKCIKAYYKKNYKTHKGVVKTNTIVAWFCPELPYSFGPKEYNSLPGLILELEEDGFILVATKLIFNEKEILIEFPKGKYLTSKEYNKQILSGN